MAALARSNPGDQVDMPPRKSSQPLNTDDKIEILQAIGAQSENLVGLRSDVSYMTKSMDELGKKVDRIEEAKASRAELIAAESRMEKRLSDYKDQNQLDMGRKVDASDFNPNTLESALERIGNVEMKAEDNTKVIEAWKNKASGGWIVLCKVGAVFAAIISSIAFALHEYIAITKPH